MSNRLFPELGLTVPVVQAPMAGGATSPALVAAVSEAGALGSFAAALLEPEAIAAAVAAIRAATARPFAVNLFVLDPPQPPSPETLAEAQARLAPWYARYGMTPAAPARWCPGFEAQFEAVLALRPAVASFAFGLLAPERVARLRAAGIRVVGTATSVAEARAWRDAGADAVCVQGAEAGGHRGTFLHRFEDALVGTLPLLAQTVPALDIPVVAAGGLMDGHAVRAVQALGAAAAQLGTAFLFCPEAGLDTARLDALQAAGDTGTRLTRAFSGRPARGVVNAFLRAFQDVPVPPYPIQNALTAALRAEAQRRGDVDAQSLWAGQGVARGRRMPAAALVATLERERRGSPPAFDPASPSRDG